MTVATGVGSLPGEDYAEAVRVVLGELPDLPHLPELPARGVHAGMTARGLAVVDGLAADLQPAGWRLTGGTGPGVDHRRARSLLAQDLDTIEELAQEHDGAFKVQLAGPWTLAATVERPRGDKVLADHGARRELAQSLAEGIHAHVRDVRRRMPRASELVVQLDEPALPAVLAARVPTASGFGKHRAVDRPEATTALGWVLSAVADAGATPWVHCCASDAPVDLLRDAGARGVSVDLSLAGPAVHDGLAAAVEAGERAVLGVLPAVEPSAPDPGGDPKRSTELVERWLEMVGLEPGPGLVLTPACGLAGGSASYARRAMRAVREAAAALSG